MLLGARLMSIMAAWALKLRQKLATNPVTRYCKLRMGGCPKRLLMLLPFNWLPREGLTFLLSSCWRRNFSSWRLSVRRQLSLKSNYSTGGRLLLVGYILLG
jgi:hypothetical protein